VSRESVEKLKSTKFRDLEDMRKKLAILKRENEAVKIEEII